ncbi:uridine kinase [Clonorchis sinensis]|uniref:Uridine kinase n=1 Tax=Clonorchis sinensis TaxID=79923 RepID=G7YS09_CLOSI|nr:uridine kinase [Clonorchis sinensis]
MAEVTTSLRVLLARYLNFPGMIVTKFSKPLLIGISGGSASGKVLNLTGLQSDFRAKLVARSRSKPITTQHIPADVDVVIVEGILTFYQKEIRDMLHLKIFIESDADTRLCRKGKSIAPFFSYTAALVLHDVSRKGRSLELVLDTYFKYVKPAFEEFCLPLARNLFQSSALSPLLFRQTKKYADVILPRAPDNTVGVDLITEHLLQLVNEIPITPSHCGAGTRVRNQSESCVASIRPH